MGDIAIGQYLLAISVLLSRLLTRNELRLERLKQLEVTAIFGVPGDFTLSFLDVVEDTPGLEWL